MKKGNLIKTFFVSLLGHLAVFSIFSFSFGKVIPQTRYGAVSFWGKFPAVYTIDAAKAIALKAPLFKTSAHAGILAKALKDDQANPAYYLKPDLPFAIVSEKSIYVGKPEIRMSPSKSLEPAIIFHPLLPYSFTLYFRDRQTAHVELEYKREDLGNRSSISVRRKISCGNLEVDLLSMRYMWHYLFIQQAHLPKAGWQTVKIDLSRNSDDQH